MQIFKHMTTIMKQLKQMINKNIKKFINFIKILKNIN